MFAGEGGPKRTNSCFHLLAKGQSSNRLSTLLDSVTLYGSDPHPFPEIFGKVRNAGVYVYNLNDAKHFYSGFDQCTSKISVSMSINGHEPMVLAFYLNEVVDQQLENISRKQGNSVTYKKT